MPLNKKVLTIAAKIQTASKGEGLLVFATADRNLLKTDNVSKTIASLKHSSFQCQDCKTTMVAATAVNPEPFCVVCGSHHVKAGAEVKPTVPSDDKMIAISCAHCKASNVLATSAAAIAGGSVHCASCGTGVQAMANAPEACDPAKLEGPDVGNSELKAPALEEVNASDLEEDLEPFAGADDNADGEGAVTDAPELEMSELDLEDEFGEGDEDELSADFNVEDDVGSGEVFEPPQSQAGAECEAENFETTEDQDLDLDSEGGDLNLSEFDSIPEADQGEDLIDTVDLDDTAVAVTLASVGSKLVAMKGHYAIATLNKVTAGTNADVMFTPAFREAFVIQAKKHGLRKALKAFGFKTIKTPSVSKASVTAAVAKAAEKAAAEKATFNNVWAESLAIASVGLNRNLWKNTPNTLRAAVESELRNLGVRNPKAITSSVFADNGVAYTKTLLELANKIASMSATARKEYADMLDMTDDNVEEVAADHTDEMPNNDYSEDDAEDMLSDVQSRFARPARSVESAALLRPRATSDAKSLSTASAILNGTAKLKFSSLL